MFSPKSKSYFLFQIQSCELLVASYAYDKTRVVINTTLAEFSQEESVKVLEFTIDDVSTLNNLEQIDDFGNYSQGGFRQVPILKLVEIGSNKQLSKNFAELNQGPGL